MAETGERAPEGGDTGNTTYAAVAYILPPLSGLVIQGVADDRDTYTQWHANQAIGLGVAVWLSFWILAGVGAVLGFAGLTPGSASGMVGAVAGIIFFAWLLLPPVLIVFLAYRAYQGETVRLPLLADWADDHA